MSFQFHVLKVWPIKGMSDIPVIGVIETGNILPPVMAHVSDRDVDVEIRSIALTGGRHVTGLDNELTLMIRQSKIDPKSLEGCRLVSTSSE